MKCVFNILILAVALHVQLAADDVAPKNGEKTFVQEYCNYSITLPEGWKLVGDESDIQYIKPVSGLYRYIPGPTRDIASADWVFFGNQKARLQIYMIKRPPEKGIGACIQNWAFTIRDLIYVEDKGINTVQNKKAQWWIGKDCEGVNAYIILFGNHTEIYSVMFSADHISPEMRSSFDDILKTITFLK